MSPSTLPPLLEVIISEWLDLHSVMSLDIACCNKALRPMFLDAVAAELRWPWVSEMALSNRELTWLTSRKCSVKDIMCRDGISRSVVRRFVRGCRGLLSLDLTDCSSVNDMLLGYVGKYCEDLVTIRLDGCSRITDSGILSIAGNRNLEVVSLYNCFNISHEAINRMIQLCPHLYIIDLSLIPSVNDSTIFALVQVCSDLENILIAETNITDASIHMIEMHCPALTVLNVSFNDKITYQAISSLLVKCTHLNMLVLENCSNISEEMAREIQDKYPYLDLFYWNGGPDEFDSDEAST